VQATNRLKNVNTMCDVYSEPWPHGGVYCVRHHLLPVLAASDVSSHSLATVIHVLVKHLDKASVLKESRPPSKASKTHFITRKRRIQTHRQSIWLDSIGQI